MEEETTHIQKLGDILVVVHLLLFVRNIDGNQVGVLDVAHLDLLLFESVPCLVLAMIKSTVKLLAAALDLLAHTVIFTLCLA